MSLSGKKTSSLQEEPHTCVVIGAGSRGSGYAVYSKLYPQDMKVVGVAEPNKIRRERMVKAYDLAEDKIFTDWRDAAKQEKFADFVIIATVDQDHKDPAVAFARLGYHILLEKPMAVTEKDCREIVDVCREHNVKLAVGHVLRYTAWVTKIKEIITSGQIGDVVSIRHTEPVGFWHFAHSYVRGNWRKEGTSTFSLMAKSCHDLDLINYWMLPQRCVSVSSFGKLSHFTKKDKVGYWHFAHSFVRGNWRNERTSTFSLMSKSCHDVDLINYWMSPRKCVSVSSFGKLTHFTPTDKPAGAGSRCLDCSVESTCPYSAKRLYLGRVKQGHKGWPVSVISDIPDIENVTEALRTGPYGKCVYDTDNDVVSHQVVNFQFEDGATVCFNMVAFTKRLCAREVKIYGTKGEIAFEDGWKDVQVFDFLTNQTAYHNVTSGHPNQMGGHGGADFHLMQAFINTLGGKGQMVVTGPEETLNSHLLVFAAEKARVENRVVTIKPDGTF